MKEPAPDFYCIHTATRVCTELLPLLEDIASTEFRMAVMQNQNVDDEEADIDTSANMIGAILIGFLNSQKKMYLDYGKKVSSLLYSDSQKELDHAIDALFDK